MLSCIRFITLLRFHLLSIFLIFLFNHSTVAQSYIPGKIISENSDPLSFAFIAINQDTIITDQAGTFKYFRVNEEKLVIQADYFGYEKLDTLISEIPDSIIIQLQPELFELESPVIIGQESLFNREDWIILDFMIYQNHFLILGLEGLKRKLYLYTPDGTLLTEKELDTEYRKMHQSCLGGIHLIGDEYGAELFDVAELKLSRNYPRKLYNEQIHPCLYKGYNYLILFREDSFGKRYALDKIQDGKAVNLKTVIDQADLEEVYVEFREIMRLYYMTTGGGDENAIDYGFFQENKVADGNWSGVLSDLMVSNGLQKKISYFSNVIAGSINVLSIVQNDMLYVLDIPNKELSIVNIAEGEQVNVQPLEHPFWKLEKIKLLRDYKFNQCYLISDDFEIMKVNFYPSGIELDKIKEIKREGKIIEHLKIYNNTLYYSARSNLASPKNKLYYRKLY